MIIINCYIQEKKITEITYDLIRVEIKDCINFFDINNKVTETLIRSIMIKPTIFKNDFKNWLKSYEKIIVTTTGFRLKEEQELVEQLKKMINKNKGE